MQSLGTLCTWFACTHVSTNVCNARSVRMGTMYACAQCSQRVYKCVHGDRVRMCVPCRFLVVVVVPMVDGYNASVVEMVGHSDVVTVIWRS